MQANTEIIEKIVQSKLPIDWVTPQQFSLLTGIPVGKLHNRRRKWTYGVVWFNDGEDGKSGNVYYSIKGFNQWLSEQATKSYRQAFGSLERQSKSISKLKAKDIKLRCRYLKQQQEQTPLKILEMN